MSDPTRSSQDQDDVEVREPENSTVDDWYGQRVERDMERAEEIDRQEPDPERAEEIFDERSEDSRPEDLPTEERAT